MTKTRPTGVIVLMKNPVLGSVKTRLASTIGHQKALDIYKKLLKLTSQAVRDAGLPYVVCYSHFIDPTDVWLGANQKYLQLASSDLGARMSTAIRHGQEHFDKVILIGTDCADLDGDLLRRAAECLDEHDACVGPASDGGFYLFGVRRWVDSCFDDIVWSTSDVFDRLMENIHRLQWTSHILPERSDIDYEADWQAYLSREKSKSKFH